ncbi:Ca2+-binding EF-hand superfamily protein [Roseovarius sp. MBR-154]|jgi:Ca2+-binding EF-hand superfamily protein
MKRFYATLLASTSLLVAAPALAQSEAEPATICQNAFYPADKDNDGTLTKTEIKNHRDAVYEQLDANKDGSIDREEYVNCVGAKESKSAQDMQEARKDGRFTVGKWSDLKIPQKDQLSAQEFAELAERAWTNKDTEMQAALSSGQQDGSRESFAKAAVDRFRAFDADDDGILTKSEYENHVVTEGRWSEEALNARFDDLDADGSGGISPTEFRGAGTWAPQPGQADTQASDTGTTENEGADAGGTVAVPVFYYYIEVL